MTTIFKNIATQKVINVVKLVGVLELYIWLVGMQNGVAAIENTIKISLKIIIIYITQQFHFWVLIQKNWNPDLKKIIFIPMLMPYFSK